MKKIFCIIIVTMLVYMGFSQAFTFRDVGSTGNVVPVAAGSGASTNYFEETGYPAGWAVTAGTANPDYTAAPMEGAQSLLVTDESSAVTVTLSASTPNVYLYFQFDHNGGANTWINVIDGGSWQFAHSDNGSLYITSGTVNTGGSLLAGWSTANTVYYYWLEYEKGSGANGVTRLYCSTTTTKPGTPMKEITNGDGTSNTTTLILKGWKSDAYSMFDSFHIRTTSAFGSGGS